MPKLAVPVQISPTDESILAEVKESIRENNVESVVFRDKTDNVNANYTIAYQKNDENSQFVCYDFFYFILHEPELKLIV